MHSAPQANRHQTLFNHYLPCRLDYTSYHSVLYHFQSHSTAEQVQFATSYVVSVQLKQTFGSSSVSYKRNLNVILSHTMHATESSTPPGLLFEHCFIGIIANIGERQYRLPRTNSCELHYCLCLIARFVCIWAKGHLRWRQGMLHLLWNHSGNVAYKSISGEVRTWGLSSTYGTKCSVHGAESI